MMLIVADVADVDVADDDDDAEDADDNADVADDVCVPQTILQLSVAATEALISNLLGPQEISQRFLPHKKFN